MSSAISRICSLKRPSGLAARSSSRSSASKAWRRSPNRCGAALDKENTLATISSASRTTDRPGNSMLVGPVNPAAR
jgi:hypothetical protein